MAAITALAVMNSQHQQALKNALRDAGTELLFARDYVGARGLLEPHPEAHVVLSGLTLPDGNRSFVHKALHHRASAVELIVALPERGKDVPDILGRGAFAVIAPPFHRAEILPLIEGAGRKSADRRQTGLGGNRLRASLRRLRHDGRLHPAQRRRNAPQTPERRTLSPDSRHRG